MKGVRGQFPLTIDTKGRLTLPAKVRDCLTNRGASQLILTNYKGSLWGYIEEDWVRYEDALMAFSPFEQESLEFTHGFIAGASECEVDRQGRILIPPVLRRYAGLDKSRDVVLTSVMDRLEIWNRERWEKVHAAAIERLDQTGGPREIIIGKLRGRE